MEKIKMEQSVPGTINGGLNVVLYKKGLVYKVEDMSPEVVQTFLDNNYAVEHVEPEEVIRHRRGMGGAPANKRLKAPEIKFDFDDLHNDEDSDPKVIFTAEELEGAKASDIRNLGKQHNVDLSDLAVNTSAVIMIEEYLKRQGE